MAARSGTRFTIYAAIAGNLLVALTKFGAALFTGSSAMLSEAFHSTVDTANEGLLLFGEYRAARPPDRRHPFGHGREIYFWSFAVAILLFAVGAGLSVYEGVNHILRPSTISDPIVNYVVLALSAAFEGASWRIAFRQFRWSKGDGGFWQAIRRSKDPPNFMVLIEDTAALIGIAIAFGGTVAAVSFQDDRFDGAASIAIGLLLALVSAILARETKSLLLGEPASSKVVEKLGDIAGREPIIGRILDIWTTHIGPDRIIATLAVDLPDSAMAKAIREAVERIEAASERALKLEVTIFIRPLHNTARQGEETSLDELI